MAQCLDVHASLFTYGRMFGYRGTPFREGERDSAEQTMLVVKQTEQHCNRVTQ